MPLTGTFMPNYTFLARFKTKYIQFKPKGAGVALHFSSDIWQKQKPTLTVTPGISQLLGISQPYSQNLTLLTA